MVRKNMYNRQSACKSKTSNFSKIGHVSKSSEMAVFGVNLEYRIAESSDQILTR